MTVVGFDPLRDSRHKDARAARDLADWLRWLELEGKADRTRDGYERDIAKLLRTFPEKTLGEFTDGDLCHLLASWPERSRPTRAAPLKKFFEWAYKTKRIPSNPMDFVPTPRRHKQEIHDVFNDAEIAQLEALDTPDGELLALLFGSGIRKGEARLLRMRDISLKKGELHVLKGKGSKARVVPLTERAIAAVDTLETLEGLNGEDHLWSTRPGGGTVVKRRDPISETAWFEWWRGCVTRAGVRYRKPHMTRHTYATWLIEELAMPLQDVKELLGHASIATTADIYVHTQAAGIGRRLRERQAVKVSPLTDEQLEAAGWPAEAIQMAKELGIDLSARRA